MTPGRTEHMERLREQQRARTAASYAKRKRDAELRAARDAAEARRLETLRGEQARLRAEFYERQARRGVQMAVAP